MRLVRIFAICAVAVAGLVVSISGTAAAAPRPCPASNEQLADLPELEAFVIDAGGMIGGELTSSFEFVDENEDGLICFKTLPAATPFPTPPLLAGDNKLPKTT